jgi:phosphatidylinositol 4-phosphatase
MMKKFLNKLAVKTPSPSLSPGLPPRDIVPPVPHPCHDHIALLVTKEGLLLRPQLPGLSVSQNYARIRWGKDVEVEELEGDSNEGHNWAESVIVYGIVGVLELFSGMPLYIVYLTLSGHLLTGNCLHSCLFISDHC